VPLLQAQFLFLSELVIHLFQLLSEQDLYQLELLSVVFVDHLDFEQYLEVVVVGLFLLEYF
jgi:hypothetical protein